MNFERWRREQRLRQRFQTGLARDLSLGAALGLIGRIEVFKFDLAVCAGNGALQFRRQLALLGDALQNRRAAILQLAQIAKPLFKFAQLGIVQAARLLLAVAGDERHGRAFTQKLDGGSDLGGRDVQLLSDAGVDLVHGHP